ncbi:MAG TPA: hypothetical protein VHN14_08080 [Kofleriaceae bacterium]|jgi:hypothetical protein|nr:hypothetical protein [Kofleriaceae bacterium]
MLRGLVLALVALEGVAWADDSLAQARKAVAESDYMAARTALVAARDAGQRSPEETAEIFRLSGIVAAALGDARTATDEFTHLLALSPKATLPPGTSPKIKRPFDAAARYFTSHAPLEVKIETVATPPTITLVAVSDPLNMVAKVHVVFSVDGGVEQTKDAVARERTDVTLVAGRRIDARVAALDVHGNRLVEIGSKDVPIVIIGEAPPVSSPTPKVTPVPVIVHAAPRPIYLRWWPYAAGTAVFGGITLYVARSAHVAANDLEALNRNSVFHTFDEARAIEDRGRRDVLFTNIGLGITGACALAAGVMYLLTPRDHVETRVTAVPIHGGAALVLGGSW